jgi:DNA primase
MEIIEQVRQVSSIIEIASQYTALRRRGRKHVGLCPFHSEKTPSFTVDEEKQLFHCFGCGVGGDVFSLVMEKENLGFAEALRYLAEKYRIPLPQHGVDPQVLKLEEKLFKINEMALAFYRRNLFGTPEGKKALEYLKKRGLTDATIETLKIGYAMDAWGALIAHFQTKDVPPTLLEKAGLALPGKKKDEYYDRFRGRVIFPIFSLTGKVVAFGGRTVTGAEPKYLNSPDTPLYSKGKLLYGLNISKDAIREAGEAILVEGYTDYAALYQAGIGNVVASLGTALTPFQVAQAARFTPRLIINYDGDSAGKNACARAVPLCLEKGMNVDALILPEGLDPDAFLAKHGRDRYLRLLKKSVHGLDFLIDTYVRGVRMDLPEEKARVIRAVIREIEKVPDALSRGEYLRQAGERLGVDEAAIRNIIGPGGSAKDPGEGASLTSAEKRLLQILFENKEIAADIFEEVREGDFLGLRSEPVFSFIRNCFRNGVDWNFADLKDSVDAPFLDCLSRALQERPGEASAKEAKVCVRALRKFALQKQFKETKAKITKSEKSGDKENVIALVYQLQEITKQMLALGQ